LICAHDIKNYGPLPLDATSNKLTPTNFKRS